MKNLIFGAEAKLAEGVRKAAEAVGATMGPKGRLVVIDQGFGAPVVTRDGVTVARSMELSDPVERMGAALLKEAAGKTNDVAGDGTTTASVLAAAIYAHGRKRVTAGENPVTVKDDLESAAKEVALRLAAAAKPVESADDLATVAGISANDAGLGRTIASVMWEVGKGGLVAVENAAISGVEAEVSRGFKVDSGLCYPFMATDPQRMAAEIDAPRILVTDQAVTSAAELVPVIESLAKQGVKKLLVFCEHLTGEAQAVALINRQKGLFDVVAVRNVGLGEHRKTALGDLCAATGAELFSETTGRLLADAKPSDLGTARRAVVTRDSCLLVEPGGDEGKRESRLAQAESDLEAARTEYDRQKAKERLARLTGVAGVVRVGGTNEVEQKERRYRVEDAVNAARSAWQEGVVQGGGTAVILASEGTSLAEPCKEPFRRIVSNAGHNADVELNWLVGGRGFDAATGNRDVDLMLAGVIDPVLVTKTALLNAASIAGSLLVTAAAITNEPDKP